jgi:holdfast attachment protein HfaA
MSRSFLPIAATLAFAASVIPALAHAQSGANFNAGYGRSAGDENRAMAMSTIRDANGNLLIVDGIIQTANGGSANYSSNSSGVGTNSSAIGTQSSSGVGGSGYSAASSVAIGNQLNVITTGNYNTVVVNNNQTNNGAISAGSIGNGGVSNAN